MKKKFYTHISLCLILTILLSVFTPIVPVNAEELIESNIVVEEQMPNQDYITVEPVVNKEWSTMKGDLNFDGVLDITDYQQMINMILTEDYRPDTRELNDANILYDAADFNGDTALDVLDAAAMQIEINFGTPTQMENYLGDATPSGIFDTMLFQSGIVYDVVNDKTYTDCIQQETSGLKQDPLSQIMVFDKDLNGRTFYRTNYNTYAHSSALHNTPTLLDNGYFDIPKPQSTSDDYIELVLSSKNNSAFATFYFNRNISSFSSFYLFGKKFTNVPTSTLEYSCNVTDILPNRTINAQITYDDNRTENVKFYATELDGSRYTYWYGQDELESTIQYKGGIYSAELNDTMGKVELFLQAATNETSSNYVNLKHAKNSSVLITSCERHYSNAEENPPYGYFSTFDSIKILDETYEYERFYLYHTSASQGSYSSYPYFEDNMNKYVTDTSNNNYVFVPFGKNTFVQKGITIDNAFAESVNDFIFSSSDNRDNFISSEPIDIQKIKEVFDYNNSQIALQYNKNKSNHVMRLHYNYPDLTYTEDNIYALEVSNDYDKVYPDIKISNGSNYETTYRVYSPDNLYETNNGHGSLHEYYPLGYEFVGWATSPNGECIVIPSLIYGETVMFENDYINISTEIIENMIGTSFGDYIDLYAIWKPVKMTVYYTAPPITTTGSKVPVQTNSTYILGDAFELTNASTQAVFSRDWGYNETKTNGLVNASTFGLKATGYKFIGWKVAYISNDLPLINSSTIFDQSDETFTSSHVSDAAGFASFSIVLEPVWESTT